MMKNKKQHWGSKEPTSGKHRVDNVMKIKIVTLFFSKVSRKLFPRVT